MQPKSSNTVSVVFPPWTRDELVARLRSYLPGLSEQLPVTRVALFGSWARGRATASSDVDLLVVYHDPPRADAYHRVRESIPLSGLEPHVYAASEAAQLSDVLPRMTENCVELLDRKDRSAGK